MKIYKPPIGNYQYKLSATQEIREALRGLGFENVNPHIDRGRHWEPCTSLTWTWKGPGI